MKRLLLTTIVFALAISMFAQGTDKGVFKTYPAGFYHKVITKDIVGDEAWTKLKYEPKEVFKMDMDERIYPVDMTKYNIIFHIEPLSQGSSGTCWSYAATSFMEAESFRITGNKTKLSEMFNAYWEYMERAQEFVKTKGNIYIGEGSESNAILRIMKNHGMMPATAFTGLINKQNYNNHEEMFEQYESYLNSVKLNKEWDEKLVMDSVKKILDHFMGTPAEKFEHKGNEYTPKTFMTEVMQLNASDYFSFMSTKEIPFNQKGELVEDDNWWHCKDYYNLSLNDFNKLINYSVTNGYTVAICGDVSEPGYDQIAEVGIIPDFDIPAAYINDDARQLRLTNGTTTDDHCIHIVGYQKVGDLYWYLIKDSGSGAFDGRNKGYRFYHEDYIKLKMMNIMIHVVPARIMLDKIIK